MLLTSGSSTNHEARICKMSVSVVIRVLNLVSVPEGVEDCRSFLD